MNPIKKTEHLFFLILFSFIIGLLYFIFSPLASSLIFGGILAGSALPLKKRIQKKWGCNDATTALIICLLISIIIIVPMIFVSIQMSKEVVDIYGDMKHFFEGSHIKSLYQSDHFIPSTIKKGLSLFNLDASWQQLEEKLIIWGQSFTGVLLNFLNKFVGNIFKTFFNFAMTLLTVYALLCQGSALKKYIFTLSPLSDDDEELLLQRFNQMNYVSLICNGLGGLIQGGIAGLLFLVLGIDSPFLWTFIMIILAFVPLLGISVITIPAALILFFKGETFSALILFSISTAVAFWTENFGMNWHISYDQLSFGYWGDPVQLRKIEKNLKNLAPLMNEKSKKMVSLARGSWKTILSTSPAEPGLSRLKTLPGTEHISAGGWADLHPTLVLKALDCKNVIYITRINGETVYGQGVVKRLLGLDAPSWERIDPKGGDKTRARNNSGDLNDMSSKWSKLYNVANPESAFAKSLKAADAVWCTNWDQFYIQKGYTPVLDQAYSSKLYVSPENDSGFFYQDHFGLGKLEKESPETFITKADQTYEQGWPSYSGCIPFE